MSNQDPTGIAHFEKLAEEHGDSVYALGCIHTASLEASYRQFWKFLNGAGLNTALRIADIGGGHADLYHWLKKKGALIDFYANVEPVAGFRAVAADRYGDNPNFYQYETLDSIESEVNKGGLVLNVVVCLNMFSHWERSAVTLDSFYREWVARCAAISTKLCAINCISPFADWFGPNNTPVSVASALSAGKQASEQVSLDFTECPHLMMLGIDKRTSDWRKNWRQEQG